jgi:hypothetical protein
LNANADRSIDISELIGAVDSAVYGCTIPTPIPLVTPTQSP